MPAGDLIMWAVGVLGAAAFANTAFLAGIFTRMGRIASDLEHGALAITDHETRIRKLEGQG